MKPTLLTANQELKLSVLARQWSEAEQTRDERRSLWNNYVRDKIKATLELIKKESKIPDMSVQDMSICKNVQTINIGFNKSNSGIIETVGSKVKVHAKHGGTLCFSQSYNQT